MPNRLAQETSPYLRQHADNPVDWYAWNDAALKAAREDNKPILLSIGYSACHWCHVMAHESFEDPATASLMNEHFINIKVDREERPDLDKIYQTAQYLLNQRSGGWPLTMFLTPDDQIPFFGGTYFPPEAKHGLPSFKDLLLHIAQVFKQRRHEIGQQNESMQTALQRIYNRQDSTIRLHESALTIARKQLLESLDERFGGFGKAPKFPHPTNIERLLRDSILAPDTREETLRAARFTLEKMARGGIFDQIGGGFCRYSVDDYWMIPHFEKMLYDNGALLSLYCQAHLIKHSIVFENTIRMTADWILHEMQSPQGAYYSSLDADSEGEEGKFYVWQIDELKQALTDQEFTLCSQTFGLDRRPNFEGHYHLHQFNPVEETGKAIGLSESSTLQLMQSIRSKLFVLRESRERPARDEKILTSWNGLMIKGMTLAGRVLGCQAYIDSAHAALQFIMRYLWNQQRLLATCKDDHAHLNAYLDDYAFLLDAILEVLQTRWSSEYMAFAQQLADIIIDQFQDTDAGGFFFTSHDHENLIQRPKVLSDEATPSGGAIAALSLNRLGYLLAHTRYLDSAERAVRAAAGAIMDTPLAHASFLAAYEEQLKPTQTIIITGTDRNACETWQQHAQRRYHPARMVIYIPGQAKNLPLALSEKTDAASQSVMAYVCTGRVCRSIANSEDEFLEELS